MSINNCPPPSKNRCLNFLKGIACIGVVFIHYRFPEPVGNVVLKLSSFAVPFFLMIAGFYAFDRDNNTIKRRLLKIIKYYLIAYIFYFFWRFGIALIRSEGYNWLSNYNYKTPFNLILFCSSHPLPEHLWYLIAMAEIYIFWFLLKKTELTNKLPILPFIVILFILKTILSSFCKSYNTPYIYNYNVIISGALPYFLTGFFIHSKERIIKLNNKILITILLLSSIMLFIQQIIFWNINFKFLLTIFYPISIFLFGIINKEKYFIKPFEYIGEHLSLNIYIFHIFISEAIYGIFKYAVPSYTQSIIFQWTRPILVVLVCILFAYIIHTISTRKRR